MPQRQADIGATAWTPTKPMWAGTRFVYRRLGADAGVPVMLCTTWARSWATGIHGSSTASPPSIQ